MRITLKNFRCHIDGTFEFPDQGLIAISGSSGSGKSSLLKAICYGFYGKIPGKVKKPYTHGKTTSSVEIEYLGLVITRHAKPKRLLVTYDGVEYEEDPAQDIITQTLGMNYGEFLAAAYVIQRGNTSVLSLSSAEQIKFIETLANSSSERYHQEVKEKIKSIDCEMVKVKAELGILGAQLEEKEGVYPEIPMVPKEIEEGIDPDKVRAEIKRLEASLLKYQHTLEETRVCLESARTEEKKRATTDAKVATLKKEIEELKRQIHDTPSNDELQNQVEELDIDIDHRKTNINYYRNYLSYIKEREKFDAAVKDHQDRTYQRLEELKSKVVDDPTIQIMEEEVSTAEQQQKEYDSAKARYDVEITSKEKSRKELGVLFKTIKAFLSSADGFEGDMATIKTPSQMIECLKGYRDSRVLVFKELRLHNKKRMRCPGCSACVVVSDDGEALEPAEEDSNGGVDEDIISAIQVSIDILDTYISKVSELSLSLNTKIKSLGNPPPDPLTLHKNLLRVKRIKKEYEELDPESLPPVIFRMKSSLEESGKDFLRETTPLEEAEAYLLSLEDEIFEVVSKRDTIKQNITDLEISQHTLKTKTSQLAKLSSSTPRDTGPNSKTLEDRVAKITLAVSDTNIAIQSQRRILDSVADYEHYQATLLEIDGIHSKIEETESRMAVLERRLEGAYGLEEAEKEAEILALEETVSSINEHAKIYLDQMFSDPIMVRLECIKDKGKGGPKLQLNTVIDYKGDTYDDIEELSGGERQRSDIAFLLAVNDMLGSPFLILDECLNELDASINTEVLSLIRDMCGGTKLILVISHEAVRGVFDDDIPVGH
jgi:DNA repair exonuclease SbcCD ATPase subunit